MKAAVRTKYGPSQVLNVKEVAKPVPRENELLIRVFATTVNRTDCHVLTGLPIFMRLFTGLFKPAITITGTDFAGQIESIGKNVKTFKVGDRVMGFNFLGLRSHAEFLVLADTKEMALIPEQFSFEQAVACVEGVYYALGFIYKIRPMAGQTALVNGATGAIGTAVLQIFKYYGLLVTAVCSGDKTDLIKSLGADRIIDYKTSDFTKDNAKYDFIFDAVGKNKFSDCKHLLKDTGIYSSSGGPNVLQLLLSSISGGKKEIFSTPEKLQESLNFIKELVEKGSYQPVIDRKYPIEKIAEAFDYVARGEKTGNVILQIGTGL